MSMKVPKQKPVAASDAANKKHLPSAKPHTARKPGVAISRLKGARPESKSDRVLSLLKQAGGATLDELMKATRWQAHSVRGYLSSAVKKGKGLTVLSACDGAGIRRYRIQVGKEA